jgi:hypothetical protein
VLLATLVCSVLGLPDDDCLLGCEDECNEVTEWASVNEGPSECSCWKDISHEEDTTPPGNSTQNPQRFLESAVFCQGLVERDLDAEDTGLQVREIVPAGKIVKYSKSGTFHTLALTIELPKSTLQSVGTAITYYVWAMVNNGKKLGLQIKHRSDRAIVLRAAAFTTDACPNAAGCAVQTKAWVFTYVSTVISVPVSFSYNTATNRAQVDVPSIGPSYPALSASIKGPNGGYYTGAHMNAVLEASFNTNNNQQLPFRGIVIKNDKYDEVPHTDNWPLDGRWQLASNCPSCPDATTASYEFRHIRC